MDIKNYVFYFYVNSYIPGWDDWEYICKEVAVGVRQPFFSERECFVAVLQQEGLLDCEIEDKMTVDFLEQLLLSNNIYVQFKDGE